eukprot:556954-Rhodomonas_salina.2
MQQTRSTGWYPSSCGCGILAMQCSVLTSGGCSDQALHPQHPIMCTTGADESIRLWDLRSKRLLAQHRPQQLPGDFGTTPKDNTALLATCCDFSPKHPHHLAVGLDDGTVMAFAYEGSMLGVVHRERVLTSRVTCVRFSPGMFRLANVLLGCDAWS